ncbi:MAG: JAB domain-containing protein [Cyanobacteria bacterium SZAS TMP-1]|nr:JAB domain-containing protein [Cyanobacteria bacterium SZAS TMP-1]
MATATRTGKSTKKSHKQEDWSQKLHYEIPRIKLYLVNEARVQKPWPSISSAEDAARLLRPLTFASEEHFVSLHLNTKFEVMGLHEVSHGTLSASLVHPREVFKAALVANSYAIIVCHNHPSGAALKASVEDLETTRQLVQAGQIMGVSVLDHIIVGPDSLGPEIPSADSIASHIYSIRQHHPELWSRD